ncbi:c-type cytochrome [Rhodoferax sp.]|uniref:c-type cytochrome n=1 Tax=Rhodoferax sp. TaxID=50421 RepID=UPI001EB84DED|nr:c-type cytochrome [Rhodoferax sp.]MBT9505409.1 c-type cytochrome [Rhodoferax sp.]
MSRFLEAIAALALLCAADLSVAQGAAKYPGVGRAATASEVAAWDIDVRPDFKGLPAGSGSVAKGQDVWESKCAACHGVFGESNEVFSPLVGGTTADDVKTGRVARLLDASFPGRTTLMKVATVSTLWDYINRAMPWSQPKSLTPDEVYAVTAFLLNLGGVVPDDFVLSDKTMSQAQARLPNRNGMTTAHALWPGQALGGKRVPDIKATACMSNCISEPKIASFLPDFARNAHGNLAEQNRVVGAQHGADTNRPEVKGKAAIGTPVVGAAPPVAKPVTSGADASKAALNLAGQNGCTACHGVSQKIVGPSFADIGKKHAGKVDYLVGKIRAGGSGVWGPIPMPAQTLSEADARTIATWLSAGASK